VFWRRGQETEKTALLVAALSGVLQAQPALLEHLPALGPLPRLLRTLSAAPSAAATGLLLRLLSAVGASVGCVDALAKLECVAPLAAALRHHAEHTAAVLDVVDKLVRQSAAAGAAEELAQQCVAADLPAQLLHLLDESAPGAVHLTPAGRATVVSILKVPPPRHFQQCRLGIRSESGPHLIGLSILRRFKIIESSRPNLT